MATKLFCDVCDNEVLEVIQVQVKDGEHPHNGSTMYKIVDICWSCLKKLSDKEPNGNFLYSNAEFDDIKRK